MPDWPLIWIKARLLLLATCLLLLAAAVADEEVQNLAFGVLGPRSSDVDRDPHALAAAVVGEPRTILRTVFQGRFPGLILRRCFDRDRRLVEPARQIASYFLYLLFGSWRLSQ